MSTNESATAKRAPIATARMESEPKRSEVDSSERAKIKLEAIAQTIETSPSLTSKDGKPFLLLASLNGGTTNASSPWHTSIKAPEAKGINATNTPAAREGRPIDSKADPITIMAEDGTHASMTSSSNEQ